jgi:FAD/FMN-containing dehydrogenase
MAKYGLAADNVVEIELVTADGAVLQVSADSHPDLFWALRRGGGNFGSRRTSRIASTRSRRSRAG